MLPSCPGHPREIDLPGNLADESTQQLRVRFSKPIDAALSWTMLICLKSATLLNDISLFCDGNHRLPIIDSPLRLSPRAVRGSLQHGPNFATKRSSQYAKLATAVEWQLLTPPPFSNTVGIRCALLGPQRYLSLNVQQPALSEGERGESWRKGGSWGKEAVKGP